MINDTLPAEYRTSTQRPAHVHIVDYGDALLKPFSDKAHKYVDKVLKEKGVELHLGTGVKEVATGHVLLSDGTIDRHAVRGLGRRAHGAPRSRRTVDWPRAGAGASTSRPI